MIEPRYYLGVVVDNNDSVLPDKKKMGRIKIKLIPEFEGIMDKDLPWVRPFMLPVANSFTTPEIGDKVYIVSLDDYFQSLFYLGVAAFDSGRTQAAAYSQAAKFASGQYPNLKVEQYKDGTCIFRDSATGDIGVVHKSGAIIAISSDGKVAIQNDSGSLFSVLDNILSIIQHVIVGANWVGNMGIPLIYTQQASDSALATQTTNIINGLLKE